MNELQQVLLVFAIIVVVVLLWLQRKNKQDKKASPESTEQDIPKHNEAVHALNELGDAHIPVSSETQHRLGLDEMENKKTSKSSSASDPLSSDVPENQLGLSFDDEPQPMVSEAVQEESATKKSKHIVIEDTEMAPVAGYQEAGKIPEDSEDLPTFGIPKDQPPASESTAIKKEKNAEKTDPEIFVIIVMGTEEYPWPKVNQTLQGVGLKPSDNAIFAKHDSMGNEIIRVANLLEPGTFPVEEPTNTDYKTPGVVMILELPTTVKAPAVMHDMIMMARKISQRLNGRMYNAERQLIKESDLQQMRDAAVAYESEAL